MTQHTLYLQQIRSRLGKPYCEGPGFAIYLADCIEAMRLLPPSLFELVVTSPPYNIGKEYERPLPIEEYLQWTGRWVAEVHRLTTDHGAFWFNLNTARSNTF